MNIFQILAKVIQSQVKIKLRGWRTPTVVGINITQTRAEGVSSQVYKKYCWEWLMTLEHNFLKKNTAAVQTALINVDAYLPLFSALYWAM